MLTILTWILCRCLFASFQQFGSVQSLSRVQLFATPWTTARQASLSITNSWSPPKDMSIESVIPSNHPILCCPLLLLPSNFPSYRVYSNESALCIRWPKYWSFSFNICPTNTFNKSGYFSSKIPNLEISGQNYVFFFFLDEILILAFFSSWFPAWPFEVRGE